MVKRKISEERKQQLRDQLERARAKRKPAEYKNVHPTVLALPDDHNYSFKTVKGWIKESKEQVGMRSTRLLGVSDQLHKTNKRHPILQTVRKRT